MTLHLHLHPIMIPDLSYSPLSSSESGSSSPAESDALRTPDFPEHPHSLLAFTQSQNDPSDSKHVHARSHGSISTTPTDCATNTANGYGLLPSLYLDSSRVEGTALLSESKFEYEYLLYGSNDAFSSPLLSQSSPPNSRHKAQHTFPPYKVSPPTSPGFEFNLDSSSFSRHFPPGHQLNPHFARTYEIGDELGSGGYGFVVTAKNRIEGHEVAVKFIIKDKVPDYAWVEDETYGRIPTEVLLLSSLDHENIVRCLDVFEDAIFYYLVQELHGTPWHNSKHDKSQKHDERVPPLSPSVSTDSIASISPSTPLSTSNPHLPQIPEPPSSSLEAPPPPKFTRRPSHDLFECIEQCDNKCLSEDQARYVFAQIVDAVDYLDSLGVAHRDIKDENIVIDKYLKVKLIDFGSAAFSDPSEPRPFYNLFYGTTAYAASEILQKKVYQAAPAEVWTLGVLLSYLLTGTSPFPTIKEAIAGRIVFAECPRVSREALNLMHLCLDPNPQTRVTIQQVKSHLWLDPHHV
ncbi:hypothetical protein GYMLUDRAFT_871292 [Collybiopsis luxurians FD-317 M1]|nr:hypothetical protein GYMLUDRAFT_871292 [Collybiopsis luxurians FD-317 M1]